MADFHDLGYGERRALWSVIKRHLGRDGPLPPGLAEAMDAPLLRVKQKLLLADREALVRAASGAPDCLWVTLASFMSHPPDSVGILRPGDTVIVRYGFGRLTPEQFQEIGDHLARTFPSVKYLLLEADEFTQQPG